MTTPPYKLSPADGPPKRETCRCGREFSAYPATLTTHGNDSRIVYLPRHCAACTRAGIRADSYRAQ